MTNPKMGVARFDTGPEPDTFPAPPHPDRELHIVALMAAATACASAKNVPTTADEYLTWLKKKEQK